MQTHLIIYALAGLAGVASLSTMILRVGEILSNCPQNGNIFKAASLAVATGYAAIGLGLVGLIGGGAFAYVDNKHIALTVALGVSSILLGLGFANAIATLRGVVTPTEINPAQ